MSSNPVYDYLTQQTRLLELGGGNTAHITDEWVKHFRTEVRPDMLDALLGDEGAALVVANLIVRLGRDYGYGDLLPLVNDFVARMRTEDA